MAILIPCGSVLSNAIAITTNNASSPRKSSQWHIIWGHIWLAELSIQAIIEFVQWPIHFERHNGYQRKIVIIYEIIAIHLHSNVVCGIHS